MVSDPADIGDGSQNAFNVEIAVFYPDGSGAETDAILTLGATTAVSLSPNDTWTPNPTGVPSLTNTYLAKASNYVPVLAENSGPGMNAHFTYTHMTGTDRQTSAQVAVSPTGSSPWSAGSFIEEQSARTFSKPFNVSGSYHKYVWASYEWKKYKTQVCGIRGCLHVHYKWKIDSWNGELTDNNTDPACNGCANVGTVPYKVPTFTTNRSDTVPLTTNSPSATRASDIQYTYGFMLDFGGFVSVKASATYGNITSVTWNYVSPASLCGQDRLLWGNGNSVPNAPIVQSNCFNRPK